MRLLPGGPGPVGDPTPRQSTNRMAEALAWDPRTWRPITAMPGCWPSSTAEKDALKRVDYVQEIRSRLAPPRRGARGDPPGPGTITKAPPREAARLLAAYPHHLPALEMQAEALRQAGRCGALDTFRLGTARGSPALPDAPLPGLHHPEPGQPVHGQPRHQLPAALVRGPVPAPRFVDRRMLDYNRGFQYHSRAMLLREVRCPAREEGDPAAGYDPSRRLQPGRRAGAHRLDPAEAQAREEIAAENQEIPGPRHTAPLQSAQALWDNVRMQVSVDHPRLQRGR